MNEVSFLGHMISPKGTTVDPSKVQDVLDWKPPTYVHQDCKDDDRATEEDKQVCLE
jgi:hypothetical protein